MLAKVTEKDNMVSWITMMSHKTKATEMQPLSLHLFYVQFH